MASNKSFVSSPMVDDCDSFISDVSVNSKPSITELYAVNDEAFMVDKKYVNVTDLNLVSDEKVSISYRDDLEKKIDDVQVLDNVVCVDRNKDVYGSEAKTSAVVASVVIKEVGSDNVDVNTDEVVADEDVDLAGNNVFVADKKSVLVDEDVDFCEKNYVVSEQKMFIGDEDVEFAQNNYVVLNALLLTHGSGDFIPIMILYGLSNLRAIYGVDGELYFNFIFDCWILNDDAFIVDKKYVNITDLNFSSDEKVSLSDRDDLEKKIHDVQVLDNVVCVDRTKDVYGSEAKTYAADYVVIKEFGYDNVDVNTNDVVADKDGFKIHVIIDNFLLKAINKVFKRGMVVISDFNVIPNDHNLKFTNHPYKIKFNPDTKARRSKRFHLRTQTTQFEVTKFSDILGMNLNRDLPIDIIGGVIGWETEMTDVEASNGKIVKTLGITLKDSTGIVDCLVTSYLADKLLNYIITHEVKEMFYVKLQYARVHYDGEDPPMIYINKNIGSKLGILGANEDDDGSCVEN
ncbi:replication protein A 70 kDa DNA-binding subunit D [Tanacetum coccineum]